MFKLDEIMTPEPYTLYQDQSVADARQLMSSKNIRHIPIIDRQEKLVGLFTQRDLLATMESKIDDLNEEQRAVIEKSLTIAKVMTLNPTFTNKKAPIREVALYLQAKKYGCIPIVEQEKVIGVVTDSDIVSVAINLLEQIELSASLDAEFA